MKIKNTYIENKGNRIIIWMVDTKGAYYKTDLYVNSDGVIKGSKFYHVSFKRIRDENSKFMDQKTANAMRNLLH